MMLLGLLDGVGDSLDVIILKFCTSLHKRWLFPAVMQLSQTCRGLNVAVRRALEVGLTTLDYEDFMRLRGADIELVARSSRSVRSLTIPVAALFEKKATGKLSMKGSRGLQTLLELLIQSNSQCLRELVLLDCSDHWSLKAYSLEQLLRAMTWYCRVVESVYSESTTVASEALAAFLNSARSLKKLHLPNADFLRRELVVAMQPGALPSLVELYFPAASADSIEEASPHRPFVVAALSRGLPSLQKVIVADDEGTVLLLRRWLGPQSSVSVELDDDEGVEMEAATSSESDEEWEPEDGQGSVGTSDDLDLGSSVDSEDDDSGETVEEDDEEVETASGAHAHAPGRFRALWQGLRRRLGI